MSSQARRRSQFSILTDVSRRSSGKESNSPSSSYDPYRASRNPVEDPYVQYATVTIHRPDAEARSNESDKENEIKCPEPKSGESSNDEKGSCSRSPSVEIVQWNRVRRKDWSILSKKSSILSGRKPSPVRNIRATPSHRRNVSFNHIRKHSQRGLAVQPQGGQTKSQASTASISEHDHSSVQPCGDSPAVPHSSPMLPSPPAVVRRSDKPTNDIEVTKTRDATNHWTEETRKVSHELSMICEEAFNRSSLSTGHIVGSSMARITYSTATSMSIHECDESERSHRQQPSRLDMEDLDQLLADAAGDLPTSYTVRELVETRRKLIEYSTKEGCTGLSNHLTEVIAHLERLIAQDLARHRRAATEKARTSTVNDSPTASKGTGTLEFLPSISKEALSPLDDGSWCDLQRVNDHESPTKSLNVATSRDENKTITIRMVPPDSSSMPSLNEVKPLTIRKRKSPAPMPGSRCSRASSADSIVHHQTSGPQSEQRRNDNAALVGTLRYSSRSLMALEPIQEHLSRPRRGEETSVAEKKWSWFGKHKHQHPFDDALPSSKDEAPTDPTRTEIDARGGNWSADGAEENNRRASKERYRTSFLKLFSKRPRAEMEASGTYLQFFFFSRFVHFTHRLDTLNSTRTRSSRTISHDRKGAGAENTTPLHATYLCGYWPELARAGFQPEAGTARARIQRIQVEKPQGSLQNPLRLATVRDGGCPTGQSREHHLWPGI